MKILIVTSRLPMLSGKPDSFTVFKLIRYLSKNHKIALISSYENKNELKELNKLHSYCEKIDIHHNSKSNGFVKIFLHLLNFKPFQINYFFSKSLKTKVFNMNTNFKPDLIYTHLIRSAELTKDLDGKKILAYQISHTLNYKRLIDHKKRGIISFLYNIEKNIANFYDKVLFIGNSDYKSIFKDNEHERKVFISPHGVDLEYFSSKGMPKTNNVILFPADFSPETNKEASEWFCEEIFPRLMKKVLNLKVIFAGRNPSNYLITFAKHHKNFYVTGYVKDIRDYFEVADILINPVRACAGQQNKILTGMAMKLPVVSTFEANEGIGAKNNEQILLSESNNPSAFADNIKLLVDNKEIRDSIAENGYIFVHQNWSWEKHFDDLEKNVFNQLYQH